MLNILKAKQQRAETQEKITRLMTFRRSVSDAPSSALVPGIGWRAVSENTGIPAAHLAAVYAVESAGEGFGSDGRLTVLYEPHVAYKYAADPKKAQAAAPDLFYPKWIDPAKVPRSERHPYRTTHEERWDMIARAAQIDFQGAVNGFSAGRFQQMTYWAPKLGFRDALHLIEHLYEGEQNHLDVFLRYCRMDGLLPALQRGDWYAFSRYNSGIERKRQEYAAKLKSAAERAGRALA